MGVLRISLFGEVQVTRSDRLLEVRLTQLTGALLAYLLLHRHRCHPREVLTALFWSEYSEEQARGCLSTALWRLRRSLEPPDSPRAAYLITTPAGHVGFNSESDYWLDVEAFEQSASRILGQPSQTIDAADAEELERALQLHKADLLEGFYDDWVLRERERLRSLRLTCLVRLLQYYRHHRAYEQSLACGQQILNYDPLREEIHREMMRIYLESGQRTLALRQYEICAKVLSDELSIPPMEETQRLYAEIARADSHQPSLSTPAEPTGILQMLQQLRLTLRALEGAREQLQQIIQLAEQQAKHGD